MTQKITTVFQLDIELLEGLKKTAEDRSLDLNKLVNIALSSYLDIIKGNTLEKAGALINELSRQLSEKESLLLRRDHQIQVIREELDAFQKLPR